MPAIGYVRRKYQGFEGNLNTLTIKTKIRLAANEALGSPARAAPSLPGDPPSI